MPDLEKELRVNRWHNNKLCCGNTVDLNEAVALCKECSYIRLSPNVVKLCIVDLLREMDGTTGDLNRCLVVTIIVG